MQEPTTPTYRQEATQRLAEALDDEEGIGRLTEALQARADALLALIELSPEQREAILVEVRTRFGLEP